MAGKSARRRREQSIRVLQKSLGVDRDLAEHMNDAQIAPQERAAELRAQGVDVNVQFANIGADAKGVKVTCSGCGRTARMAVAPPAGAVVRCPRCPL